MIVTTPGAQAPLPQLGDRGAWAVRLLWASFALVAGWLLADLAIWRTEPLPIIVLQFAKSAVLIAVSFILIKRRPRDSVAALLAMTFLVWTISSSFGFRSTDLLPVVIDRIRFVLFTFSLLLFPDGEWGPDRTRFIAVATAATFMLGIIEATGLVQTQAFLPMAVACVLAAIGGLIARFRTAESDAVRQQLKWIALGLVLGVGLILIGRASAALTAPAGLPVLSEALFQLGIIFVALGFVVSLLRYRLYDAETAISRSAALFVLTVAVVSTFAGTEAAVEWMGQQYFGMGIGSNISGGIAAGVAAVLLNPLHQRISEAAEHRFQPDLAYLKNHVPEFLEELCLSEAPREVARFFLLSVNEALHANCSALLGFDEDVIAAVGIAPEPLLLQSAGELFPVWIEVASVCSGRKRLLLLGGRPDGSSFGRDELGAIKSLLPRLRRALDISDAAEALRRQCRAQRQLGPDVLQSDPSGRLEE
ncbi:hypothetical protein [Sphingomonas flavescens]|uniref:hypothetical protein n=1 Tax=Sphingomonas flavescens TaxID=3132797 RepID=UPI002805F0F7|nr:hypothetical protein [Sphingomonas limnosediminicola]